MKNDYEIALEIALKPIKDIASSVNLEPDYDIYPYGKYQAKLTEEYYDKSKEASRGDLVLVTAVNPTPAGEGKTTISIGLAQGLKKIGVKTALALREPSLGPVFGVKGGATGGGYSQVLPMEEINLHFTGDFHAITTANNLLCAAIDNHIHHGNDLGIDPEKILFSRCMDMNDRALRDIVIGLGGKANGIPRKDKFRITAASEVMAVFCLSENLSSLKEKLGNILIGFSFEGKPLYCRDLNMQGAMCAVLRDAHMPNLVQTIEGVPTIIHGGPFANIAHGCNSVKATKTALQMSDIAVTEAGFGADLGAEKYFDIKCRKYPECTPSVVVIVATVRALKYNGGVSKDGLKTENVAALEKGFPNLLRHYGNILKFGVGMKVIVAVNKFPTDTPAETEKLIELCKANGIPCEISEAYEKGGEGSVALAKKVAELCSEVKKSGGIGNPTLAYEDNDSIQEKIGKITRNIYGADGVEFSENALGQIKKIEEMGMSNLPVCMAKTQYSFSDDPKKLGAPQGFTIHIRDLILQTGAGFIVALTGEIMTMPGLPKKPAAELIDVDKYGDIINIC